MQNKANLSMLISKYISAVRKTLYNDNKVIQSEDIITLNL